MKLKIGDKVNIIGNASGFSSAFLEGPDAVYTVVDNSDPESIVITNSVHRNNYASPKDLKLVENIVPETKLGGIKFDQDKPDYSLLPLISTEEVVKVWTFGKKKYAAWNWTLGFQFSRPYAAALRHVFAWARGESYDPESGIHHLAHAICDLQMLLEFELTKTGEDDRRKTHKPKEDQNENKY